jgi:hypothetical protein
MTIRRTTLIAFALTLGLTDAAMAFDAFPQGRPPAPPLFDPSNGASLECAIVRHTPDRDRDPPYKITINLGVDRGVFQSLNVYYTLVSGRSVDRSEQYKNGITWTAMPKTYDWYWGGTRGNVRTVGHLYHNERDGWMYQETIVEPGRTYQMRADCHEVEGD